MKYQLMQHEMKIISLVMGLIWCLLLFANVATSTTEYPEMSSNLNPNPPNNPVRLIFIHHSTGENWLSDENGGLGISLMNNNYYVSDTNYGWGPDNIGDRTDIGNWWEWFRGPNSSTYLSALYSEGNQHCSYSRLSSAPSGENEVIMFKSCFPNSAFQGNPSDPVPSIDNNPLRGEGSGSEYHTVANAKGIYIDLLEYFRTHTDKLFIVITAPPLMESDTSASQAANARAFNNWLVNEWLAGYPYKNVAVFDFYNVLTSNGGNADTNDAGWETGNHHRWWSGAIQHIQTVNYDMAAYPTGDSHPSQAGNLKATGEYLDLLNVAYNRWKGASTSSNPCDFNGDGKTDILWRNKSSGENAVWFMDGATITSIGAPGTVSDLNWQVKGIGDFNGDGKADVLWQHVTSGQTAIWFMNGATITSIGAPGTVSDTNWQIKGIGDFNGDGMADVLWQNSTSGWTAIWFMNGATITSIGSPGAVSDSNWKIQGIGDFNGDGKADVLWHHATSGQTAIWMMNGSTISSIGAPGTVSDLNWQIKGIGDFNGDGKSDILWQNATSGWTVVWFMNGAIVSSSQTPGVVSDLNWEIKSIGDFNGDGKADVLWRHATTGWTYIWFMDGATISSTGVPAQVSDSNWQIMN